jgi:DNA-binding ferritin-like protein (Dps family)
VTVFIEKITGDLGDKKRWRQYKARVKALPPAYRSTANALERYLLYFGAGDGPTLIAMVNDLADLLERSALDGVPVRDLLGDDPVEFAEEFLRNYSAGSWVSKERMRLTEAIERAAGEAS